MNDDADTTAVVQMGLTHNGFKVVTFVDPGAALENFKAGVYDLVEMLWL